MHALAVTVSIAPGQFEGARRALQSQVIPRVKQAPGFVKGYWTVSAGHERGTSLAVFDSQQNAENAANMARTGQMPPGVTLVSSEVCEVTGEA
jgi:hypothetical protein